VASSKELIVVAVQRFQAQVPSLAKLKIVAGLELTAGGLMGAAQSERFRIEVPGPQVSEGAADDARLQLTVPRTMFNLLAEEGELVDWREAYQYGHLKVSGDGRVKRLLGQAIERSQSPQGRG
jgi:hypothetical protein